MPQPRKEQIKDLRTKFTFFLGNPVIGGGASPTQVLSGADYTNFLAATRTGVVNGAETDTPASVKGGSGPFNLSTLNTFSIVIPGYNSNLPMNVAIQAADVVILGGVPVVTTSRLANRINTVVAGYGISNPIAFNIDGSIVITTKNIPLLGSTASFTLADVVFGTLALIGLVATSHTGTSSPTRGIITQSSDGLGGYVQLKNLDQTVSEPVNTKMIHMGERQYAPVVMPGQPAFARLTNAASSLKFDFYRDGPINPNMVSASSNFSSINPGDTIQIVLNYTATFSIAFNVVFGAVTTVQNVIDQINNAYAARTLITFGVESTRASVITQIPGPWSFRNTDASRCDAFYLSFNTNPAQIHVVSTTDGAPVSPTAFATLINNAIIATLGSLTEGHAVVSGGNVVIESQILGPTSAVIFTPDTITVDPNSMLNMIGISPGSYNSSNLAFAYGSDEIQLICPSALFGAALLINGDPGIITNKLGLPVSTVISVTNGFSKVPVPVAQILIPEVVEFSEEPDNYDTDLQNFDAVGSPASVDPKNGVQNSGLAGGLLGPDGKIDPGLIASVLDFLGLNRVSLGSRLTDDLTSQLQPRIITPYNIGNGPVLVWTGTDTQGNAIADVHRLYVFGNDIFLTTNAYVSGYSGTGPASISWTIDGSARPYLYEFASGKFAVGTYPSSTPGTVFTHGNWSKGVKLNTTGTTDVGFGTELIKLGEGLTSTTANLLIPRLEVVEDATNPSRILLIETVVPGSATSYNIRMYITANSIEANSGVEITVNARWDGALWNKDNSGLTSLIFTTANGIAIQQRLSTNNAPWGLWDSNLFSINATTQFLTQLGTVLLGFDTSSGNFLDQGTPRIQADRVNPAIHHRTLLFYSGNGGVNSDQIYIYLENSDTSPFGSGYSFATNCHWDDGASLWRQDNAAHVSSLFVFGSGVSTVATYQLIKNNGSAAWTDSINNWDKPTKLNANQIVAIGSPAGSARATVTDGTALVVDVPNSSFNTTALSVNDRIMGDFGPFLVKNADSNPAFIFVSYGDNSGAGGYVDESTIQVPAGIDSVITIPSKHQVITPGSVTVKLRVQSGPTNTITLTGLDNNYVLGNYEVIRP